MRLLTKIKAGALQFVLFIGAVIAVLLLTFVLLRYSHLLFTKKTDRLVDTIRYADSAIYRAIDNTEPSFQFGEFSSEDGITATIEKRNWGLFHVYQATSSFGKNSFTKTALVGSKLEEEFSALYLKDNQRPLVVVGNAQINGDAYLPQQGIKPGNISGQSYFESKLIYGTQKRSKELLPTLAPHLKPLMENMLSLHQFGNADEALQFSRVSALSNSFKEPTIELTASEFDLRGKSLIGNILVRAINRIKLDATTQLADVILIAPEISIEDGFQGNFQAFASKRIDVGKNVLLEYPSALCVLDKSSKPSKIPYKNEANINIHEHSIVKGVLLYFNKSAERFYHPQIKIEQNATVYGQVYCEQNVELKGSVYGNLTTNAFISLENGNVYQNHFFNGKINSLGLAEQFSGLHVGLHSKKSVAKWLY